MKKILATALFAFLFVFVYGQNSAALLMNPSPNHKYVLGLLEGEWDEEVTIRLNPNSAPQKYTISCTNKSVMGGRYIEGFHKGALMGMQIEARSVVAFDNGSKSFQTITWNNISTGVVSLQGKFTDQLKSITLTGTGYNNLTAKPVRIRQVLTFSGKNEYMIEHYESTDDQPEINTVTYRCRRKTAL